MKLLTVAYVVMLHLALVGVLWKSDFLSRVNRRIGFIQSTPVPEITDYYYQMLRYHTRSIDAVPDGSVILIGDSITQSLCVTSVHPNAVNYGINGDTTAGVLMRLQSYMPALQRAKYIVLAIGINDTRYRSATDAIKNYAKILDALPQDTRVIVSAILPINETGTVGIGNRFAWIQEFNSGLNQLASERDLVTFLDNNASLDVDGDSRLDNIFDDGDGIHLNSTGNDAWAANIRRAIQNLESSEQRDARGAADRTK